MRKGFIFTMDAMIAISIVIMMIITTTFVRFETILPEKKYERLNYMADDTMNLLAYLEVRDIQDKPTINRLIENGVLTDMDMNKTVLDLIASFWYAENKTIAENISREILEGITDVHINLTVDTETIYSSNDTPAQDVAVATRIESGYEPGKPAYGYVARAFLTSIKNKIESSYAYFGGYVGEGNITRIITLFDMNNVVNTTIEMDAGSDFDLYVNGNYAGSYSPTPGNLTADEWVIDSTYFSHFNDGNNTLMFNFTGNESHIGGGYLKVIYESSQMLPTTTRGLDRYYFPGIEGVINLYSSFYIPGDLNGIDIYLHYKSNYTTFLNIGNATVYEDNSTGEEIITIPDEDVENNITSAGLSYAFLSNKTIPIRMGMRNVSYVTAIGGKADVFSVTDVSGSMDDCITPIYEVDDCTGTPETGCCWRAWSWFRWEWVYRRCDRCKIGEAKVANKLFIDAVLNVSGNRIGLVSYSTGIEDVHDLSDDETSLKNEIETYEASGWTCICCGINEAVGMLDLQSDPSKYRSIVVMSDGQANIECSQQDTGDPDQDAIQAACDAYNDYGIIVHSVGYGISDNTTLQGIADCGHGNFYYSNVTELSGIYQEIAEEILNASYVAQKVRVEGFMADTVLHPDSYIEFNYTPITIPYRYGEIWLTRETDKLKDCIDYNKTNDYVEGGWNIPDTEVEIIDAKITSYSSQYWTHKLDFKTEGNGWQRVYWLGDYGSDYKVLGDPYIVQIPSNLVEEGGNNFVRIETGVNPVNATGGSPDDRVIYTMGVRGSVGYGSVFSSSDLAIDDARERLIDKISSYVNIDEDDVDIENKTIGGIQWLWGPSLLKVITWTS